MRASSYGKNVSSKPETPFETQNVTTPRRLVKACAPCAFLIALLIAPLTGAAGQTSQTITSLVASASPAVYGQSVSFRATITPFNGPNPTGTVTFLVTCSGTTSQLAQIAVGPYGFADLVTTATGLLWCPTKTESITAQYSGDVRLAPSVATIPYTVYPPKPISISVSPSTQVLILGGNSQQYTATGHYADGSSLELTFFTTWTSSNPAVATIDSYYGLASTVGPGSTSIIAYFNNVLSVSSALGVVAPGASVLFLGGGSSAMFLELGQAAQSSAVTATPCVWTQSSALNNGVTFVRDKRPAASPVDDYGDIWITWGPGTGTCAAPAGNFNIYAYTSLDSVLGVRCYFEVDSSGISGCVQNLTVPAGTPGQNMLCNASTACVYGPDTAIPQVVVSALNLQHWFAAGTDILPADAKFATYRTLQPCGQTVWRQAFDHGLRVTQGLGYQGTVTGVGVPVLSYFSNTSFNILDFNFSGRDPINTAMSVPAYTVSTLGAKPIIVAVSPAGGSGLGAATDVTAFNLALVTEGILGRSTDLIGPTVTAPITALINEPHSGAYNVMEYSIANSSQFHTSQDANNCNGSGGVYSNALNLQSANGTIPAYRVRAVGTSEMITQLQAATPGSQRLGYFYWSAPNAANFTAANGKYLTVNGVDPLQDTYTDGVLPGVDLAHPLSNATFKWLNMGDYPIWSVLRIVSQSPTPAGVANLILAAEALNSSQHNFVAAGSLQVWHSHYYLPAIANGVASLGYTISTVDDLCPQFGVPLLESGGDAGGANVVKQVNVDFCVDFSNSNGLINKAN